MRVSVGTLYVPEFQLGFGYGEIIAAVVGFAPRLFLRFIAKIAAVTNAIFGQRKLGAFYELYGMVENYSFQCHSIKNCEINIIIYIYLNG